MKITLKNKNHNFQKPPVDNNSDIVLQCTDLCKRYGSYYGVNGIDLELEKGRIVGILGPDGSGKSTLGKMIAGISRKTRGTILIEGMPVSTATKKYISYMPEYPYYVNSTKIMDIINLFRFMYPDFNYKKVLKYLDRLNIKPNSYFGGISPTSAQMVQVILVMCRSASLYVLDEPVAHIEPKFKDLIVKTILSNMEDDSTVLIFSKTPAEVYKILDDVMFIHRGQIKLSGTVDEIKEEYGKDVASLYKEVFRC